MSKMWFARKRFGYGASLATTWQGWTVYIAYMSLPAEMLAPEVRAAGQIGAFVVLTIALFAITRAKTERAWRWRWGRDS